MEAKPKKSRGRPRRTEVNKTKLGKREQNFERFKAAFLRYKELKGHTMVPDKFCVEVDDPDWHGFEPGMKLGQICRNTRAGSSYKDEKDELTELGFDYSKQSKSDWPRVQEALLQYKALHKGNINMTNKFEVPSSEEWPEHMWEMKLGKIVKNIKAGTHYAKYRDVLEVMGIVIKKK